MSPNRANLTSQPEHSPDRSPPPGARGNPTRQACLDFNDRLEESSMRQLYDERAPVTQAAICGDVLNRFLADETVFAIAVVDAQYRPVALIERHIFIEYFSRPYSIELFGKKPLSHLMSAAVVINRQPIVVQATTSIDQGAAIIIDAGMQHMASGFIIADQGKYLGIANGHSLLNHITLRKQAELYYLAHYDQLTRVPNRLLINDRLQLACSEARRNGTLVGLMFVDLDRFKQINDSLGHRVGDLVLQAVAERLVACVRGHDTVARLGGDEFAVLLQNLHDASQALASAQRIVDQFRAPFIILEHQLQVTVSIGIALYPRDADEIDNLYVIADTAMYEAKASGRNAFREYAQLQSRPADERSSLEADLRHALERNELTLNYQPQVDVATERVAGVDTLLRWRHPQRGLLAPCAFIGLAERNGLIVDIDNWVLREACTQQVAWAAAGIARLRVSVNISAVQFGHPDFVASVRRIVDETRIDPGCIELDLSEGIAMQRAEEVLATLRGLRQIGVQLAIDNFGTAFSSLNYLQRFPIDRIKIDRSFICDIEKTPANKSIVQAMALLAHGLSLEIVAAGVESAVEFAYTSECACDEIQGYFHARPMSAEEFVTWFAKRQEAACGVGVWPSASTAVATREADAVSLHEP